MGCGQSGQSTVIENIDGVNANSNSKFSEPLNTEILTESNDVEVEFPERVVSAEYLDFAVHTSYADARKTEALYNPSLNYDQDIHEYEYQQLDEEAKKQLKIQIIEKLNKAALRYATNERHADESTILAHNALRNQLIDIYSV